MQTIHFETTVASLLPIEAGSPARNHRPSLCQRWRLLFGARSVPWRATILKRPGVRYSAIFSQCPAT